MHDTVEKLKLAIEQSGDTQEQAAHKIGTTLNTVSRWLHGHQTPSKLAVMAIESYVSSVTQSIKS